MLWTFQTGRQIAAGPTIFSAGGKEFIAITVGGTPTSSAGGLASQLQVFSLGGSSAQSPKPPGLTSVSGAGSSTTLARPGGATRSLSAHVAAAAVGARIAVPTGAITLGLWNPNSSNLVEVKGKVLLGGKPVSGAAVSVDRYTLPQKTAGDGSFTALVDSTLARRHPIVVNAGDDARVGGRPLTASEAAALKSASGGINVAYRLDDLKVVKQSDGTVKVTGRAVRVDGVPVPPVVLLSYRLSRDDHRLLRQARAGGLRRQPDERP